MDEHTGCPGTAPEADEPFVGRDAELAHLLRAVQPASSDRVVTLVGAAGLGKSALLDRVARRAEAGGTRVLRAEGSESEARLPYSALHQLLRPLRAELDRLPHRQRTAVEDAFGTGPAARAGHPDPLLLGVAVLSLLSALGVRRPVLLVLDDAQWCDRASLEALSFAARRLDGEPVTLLIAARDGDRVAGFDRHRPTLVLEPLDDAAANRLLDQQPRRPTGRTRARVLDQAGGNPLALVELARAATGPDAATDVPTAGPLPLSEHLERVFAARLDGLPTGTTRALLLLAAMDSADAPLAVLATMENADGPIAVSAAVENADAPIAVPVAVKNADGPLAVPVAVENADGPLAVPVAVENADGPLAVPVAVENADGPLAVPVAVESADAPAVPAAVENADAPLAVPAGPPPTEDDVWAPAERAGLVRRTGRDLRFRHPLVRSAVYHAAPPDARRAAHRTLAELLRDEPDRRAWHLAAACPGPDAEVSAELARTAARARRRGGHAAAATALQRAADLAPHRADSARLLVEAASAAVFTGDLAWVEELTAAVRARTDDPALLASATVQAGRLAALTQRHTTVFARLTDAAEELASSRPATALDLLADAAVVRFYSGADTQRRRLHDILARLPDDASTTVPRTWVRAVSDPLADRAELIAVLPGLAAEAADRPERLTAVGIMAWLLDEIPEAVRLFDRATDRWAAQGALPEGLGGAIAWAYAERGRWDQARDACARTLAVGRAAGLDHAVACAGAVDAFLLAHQGDPAAARARADEALTLIDPLDSRSVAVYARRALAAAAAVDGAYETAYEQLRRVFTADGTPVHYHASAPALADLTAAAVRTGHHEDAAMVVERCAHTLTGRASPRLRALLGRARGLLAAPEDAEPHFRAALADPVLAHWPLERAQTLLDLAAWLRRRRRIAEARTPLTDALEIFRRLGARPWLERTRAEARAAGLDVTDTVPDALARLSPQQQQIIRLAARGLTNREIGERLFLSPRTVGSHLYRSFPKLGITTRTQLRDLIEGTLATDGRGERGGR
ncbi:helix-turn-helix transcriptional regulator [Streptomyces fumanus]|uniref:helix-turn-helix transcriptional regulator n=1 Tax=Streptomyces fumanus TaxID=67302 RepID=UPI00340C6891